MPASARAKLISARDRQPTRGEVLLRRSMMTLAIV
jgi:hypothetical protein